jgi:hypothetical protein
MSNDRLNDIKIELNQKKDTFVELLEKYKNELEDYDHIDDLVAFSVLHLKGSLRYINKYSKELRFGGLLVKIIEKYGEYFAMIKKINGQIYTISFNNNFIFYKKNSNERTRDSFKYFLSNVDKGLYDI